MKQISTAATPPASDDAPKLTQADFDVARFRIGGEPASRADWQAAVRARIGKQRFNIMLDALIGDNFIGHS